MTLVGAPLLVRRTPHVLRPDAARVVSLPFLPGEEIYGAGTSRMSAVLGRLLALPDADVERTLAGVLASFGQRHDDLVALLDERFDLVARHVGDPGGLSLERRRLVGACMSQEYAIESAALFNPSMVAHPDQTGLPPGSTRFVMSVRAVGEGHISSVELRTGVIDAADEIAFDVVGRTTTVPRRQESVHSRDDLRLQNEELAGDRDEADALLRSLPATFPASAVEGSPRLEWLAACAYDVTFPAPERDQLPCPAAQQPGRAQRDRGPAARRGRVRRRSAQLPGHLHGVRRGDRRSAPARHRRLPLVPDEPAQRSRREEQGHGALPAQGRRPYLALSRWDRESNSLAGSSDLRHWEDLGTLSAPERAWEIVQAGNCGSPIETPAGWLVLTHGVGPMRQYSIGAMLLDLDDPRRVLGSLAEPLLTPAADERDGYVPNVVYSCGALLHGDTLVLPYGCSDAAIRVALVDLPQLLSSITAGR